MNSRSGSGKSNRYRRWWWLPMLVFLLGMCGLGATLVRRGQSASAPPKLEFLPVSLHSILEADYRANPNPALIPGVRLDLIWDAIYDREPDTTDLEARKVVFLDSLQTPVPFATSPVCQGTHIIYADQDTWVDSADPASPHGSDLLLQVGRNEANIKRILLFFPINNALPQGAFIKNARLELDIESATGSITSDSITFFNLTGPFSELATTWLNQPEPDVAYRALNHAVASTNTRTWDITDIVQDWLLGNAPTAGLVIEPAIQTEFVAAYYSREADSQTSRQVASIVGQRGPRLVINCGRASPTPETVAVLVSPTPTPVDSQPEPPQPSPPIISTIRPTPSLATTPVPPPQPTLSPPTPPASPVSPTAPPPASPLPPSQPTASPPPPPANVPPDNNRDDDPEDKPAPTPVPSLAIDNISVLESDSGIVTATFQVTLSTASGNVVTVDYAFADRTASLPADYSATGGRLTFPPGSTRQTITIQIHGDRLDEPDETFEVNLRNAVNGTLGNRQAVATIIDDDPAPALTVDDIILAEGNLGTTEAVFTVSLDAASGRTITVDVATANGTAFAGSDYTAITAQTLTFPPGVTVRTVTVTVLGDPLDEPNETFSLNLSHESNATISDGQGLGTITDDDAAPIVDFDSSTYSITESAATATITVTLSAVSGQTVSVNYATVDNSATAPADYATTGGSLTFNPGTTVQTFTVAINNDLLDETNETVTLDLSGPTNATIGGNDPATLTILDDDAVPSLSINDVTVVEGSGDTTDAVFTVTLSQVSGQTVTVDYATVENSATSPDDFTAISTTTLTFLPGNSTQNITVTVQGDTVDETTETFFVNLSNSNSATIPDPQGLGTILDDDNPTLAINDVTVTEGDSGPVSAVFTVTLSASGVETATVNFATASGTATAESDYIASSGTLAFSTGVTQQAFSIQVQADTFAEPDETFFVNLSSPLNATIADGQGLGTILDNDGGASLCSSPSITLTATADTHLRENQPGMNYGPDVDFRTRPVTVNPRTALIQFDSGSVPPNSVITCAALLLTQTSAPNTGQIIQIHRVTNSWAEGQATWITRTLGISWANPGGDFDTAIEATFVPSTTNHAMNITSMAQFWIDNPTSNFGLLMEAQNAGSNGEVQFASREVVTPTLRPRLAIEYIPTLSINDVNVTEGNTGNTEAVFTVTLSTDSTQTVTTAYTTVDGTATTTNSDYLAASGTLSFAPGVTTQTITVTVVGDVIPEGTENFFVNLSSPANAAIADGQGVGTILQDVGGLALPREAKQTYLPLIIK